ncbi:MAG TPA: site-specific integrase, partial [Methylococcaceae bacterium]|nr:site-specific integrase [Methylococcaceae bacterium]
RRFLLFLRDVGCRPGEAREILWDEIDWDLGAVVKLRHKTRKKTKRSRVIPLTTSILAMLRWMRERCDGSGEVFRTNRGDPWTKSALVQKWDRLRKKAGVPKVLCLHGIRHQFGTAAVKGGGNVKLISLAMGHSSVSTTERYYLHLDGELEAMKREMAKGKRS